MSGDISHSALGMVVDSGTPGNSCVDPLAPPEGATVGMVPDTGDPPIRRLGSSVVCMDNRPCLRSPVHGGLSGPGFLDCLVVQSASGVTALPVRRSLTWIDGTPAHRAYSPSAVRSEWERSPGQEVVPVG